MELGRGKGPNDVERVGRCCEEGKGEHISMRLNKLRRICNCMGGSVRVERDDEVKEAFYTSWLLTVEVWQR